MDLLLNIQRELVVDTVKMQEGDQRSKMFKMCVISVVCVFTVLISITIIYVTNFLVNRVQEYTDAIIMRYVVSCQ